MANPWFRLYEEFATDPKVQTLPFVYQRHLLMIFCAQCRGILGKVDDEELAHYLHISEAELEVAKQLFIRKKFVDADWNLTNWNKRQFISDCSSDRVRKHRENRGLKQDETLHETDVKQGVTAPDTDTESDTEAENSSCAGAKQVRPAPEEVPESELAGKLPLAGGGEYRISKAQVAEWAKLFPGIDVMHECRKLKAWLIGNPTKQSTKRGILKRIMNWLTRAQDDLRRGGGMNGGNANRAQERTNANRAAAREALSQLLEPDAGNGGGAWGEPERGGPEVIRGHAVAL